MAEPPGRIRSAPAGRWWRAHSQLDRLVEALVATFRRGNTARASAALQQLAEALAAHIKVEEEVHFPLVESLSRDHATQLLEAREGHQELMTLVAELKDLISGPAPNLRSARTSLSGLLETFRLHEEMEAQLIAELERATAAAARRRACPEGVAQAVGR